MLSPGIRTEADLTNDLAPDQAAKDLRFLSSIAWVGRIQVSTVTSAPRSCGSSALVKAG